MSRTSTYDPRDDPRWWDSCPDPDYCKNPFILKWWSASHDALLSSLIDKERWVWRFFITDKIVAITPPAIVEKWKAEDPLCSKYAWYNLLMGFAESQAYKLGLLKAIRKPIRKNCPLCSKRFDEGSISFSVIKRLGIDQLDFCQPCIRATLDSAGSSTLSREEVCAYLRRLSDVLQRVPSQDFGQDFGQGMYDIREMDTAERLSVLLVLKERPTTQRVKELYGSWFHALLESGLLEDGARRAGLGIQCLAKDGHLCFSLGEKTIDDLLHDARIAHEKEPLYPDGNLRADFVVNGVFIEYFGLTGIPDYDLKTKKKQELCKKHRIKLISIYPSNLTSSKKLEQLIMAGVTEATQKWE